MADLDAQEQQMLLSSSLTPSEMPLLEAETDFLTPIGANRIMQRSPSPTRYTIRRRLQMLFLRQHKN